MRSLRSTKYSVTFSGEEVIAALKAAHPNQMDVLILPDSPNSVGASFTAKLINACGLEITYHLAPKTPAMIEYQNAKHRGEDSDPA